MAAMNPVSWCLPKNTYPNLPLPNWAPISKPLIIFEEGIFGDYCRIFSFILFSNISFKDLKTFFSGA